MLTNGLTTFPHDVAISSASVEALAYYFLPFLLFFFLSAVSLEFRTDRSM